MKLSRILLFGLLFSTGIINAQTDFRTGYIIKNSGDTLFGQIDYRGDLLMGRICKFKTAENTIKDYYPNDILAYRFTDSKYYVSREIYGKRKFLEFLIKGEINIYYLRDHDGDHFYLDKEDVKLAELRYTEVTKKIEGKNYIFKSKEHLDILYASMQDAPDFQSHIKRIHKPEHQNLVKLAEDYHNAVCEGEKCIVYEKKLPLLKVNVEIVGGVIKFVNSNNYNTKKFYPETGFIMHFWMPRTNEKMYFKTGLLYSPVDYVDSKQRGYAKIPAHLGYMAPNTFRIRPSISVALMSPSYSGGVSIKVNKKINIGLQGWLHFNHQSLPWIPSRLLNYSFLGNVYIEL